MGQSPFLERSRYFLAHEYPAKVRLAVETLPHDVLWRRPNEESNSIGNLMTHLAGNIRQWIVSGIGGEPDNRNRAAEFSIRDGPDRGELLALLELAVQDADRVIAGLHDEDLARDVTIQGRDTTVFSAIYHVVEHFAMHTGQIILLTKMYVPGSVKFYEDAGGIATPLWGGSEGMKR